MKIMTNDGKCFDIIFIGALVRDGRRVVIEMEDDRALSAIAADFEGVETATKTDSERPNVKEIYEGFTQLVDIRRNTAAGTVRLTLERSEANG